MTRKSPFILLITSHWLSLLGIILIVTGVISWLFAFSMHLRSGEDNPYIGIVIFVITLIFFLGLILVPIGIYFAKEEVKERFETQISDRQTARRKLLWVLAIATAINVLIGTQLTYHGVEHMESVQFCGQSCHVMKPEFMAYQFSPHSKIACVDCHVAPGAKGFIESKMSGTRQLFETIMDSTPKPVPTALESGRLVPSKETCEHCHWAEKFSAVRLKVITKFAEDETNTQSQTVLLMLVGGSRTKGIHGSHFAPGIEIWFAKADPKRQKIPVVEYRNVKTGVKRVYKASDAPSTTQNVEMIQMQCVDCHNRPTHTFELPEPAVDRAMMGGFLPSTLPYLKKKSVEVLKANYSTGEEAGKKIAAAISEYYQKTYPEIYQTRKSDVEQAGKTVASIYGRNVFPDLKVTWGTYPNNAGHNDFPGCFRCHDEDHKTADGKTITQDCETCHVPLAMEETSPQILETLGLKKRLDSYLKP